MHTHPPSVSCARFTLAGIEFVRSCTWRSTTAENHYACSFPQTQPALFLTVLKTCLEVLVKPNKDLRPRQSEEKAGAGKLNKGLKQRGQGTLHGAWR